MIRRFVMLSFVLLGIALPCAADDNPAASAAKPPRYKLFPGQELKYQGELDFAANDGGGYKRKDDWTLLVVRQNTTGGWRLLVRYASQFGWKPKEGGEIDFATKEESLAWCDLGPDGKIAENGTLGAMVDVRSLLPLLPPSGEQLSWTCANDTTGAHDDYTWSGTPKEGGTQIVINDDSADPIDKVYLRTNKRKYLFDVKRGLVEQVDVDMTQQFMRVGQGKQTIKLVGSERHDPNWTTAAALETADYFAVKEEYDELLHRALKEPVRTKTLLSRARANLEDLRQVVQTNLIRQQLEHDLAEHDDRIADTEEDAQRFGALIGKPSPAWQTTDLTGKAFGLDESRGKVLVLDFWFRSCGWCIYAMPQIQHIANHFQGEPVAVLGMNTDEDEQDARFVVEKMGLTYPTLKAADLAEKYGVVSYPTLLIIGPDGVVRDVHDGYSPALAKEVIASVEKILAETKGGNSR